MLAETYCNGFVIITTPTRISQKYKIMPRIIQYCLFDPPEVTELPQMDAAVGDFKQNMFVDKFRPRATTDDCYMPPAVYKAVKGWVNDNLLDLTGKSIERPFYPGGDYLKYEYKESSVVIDNPPFSIYSRIVRNYVRMGISFFFIRPGVVAVCKRRV